MSELTLVYAHTCLLKAWNFAQFTWSSFNCTSFSALVCPLSILWLIIRNLSDDDADDDDDRSALSWILDQHLPSHLLVDGE